MKKISIFLSLVLIISFLFGCTSTPKEFTSSTTVEETTTASKPTETTKIKKEFESIVLFDSEECFIEVIGFDETIFGRTINFYLENRSEDLTYMFVIDDMAINGYQTSPLFANDISPGKKAHKDLTIMDSHMEDMGLFLFTEIEFHFRVYDSDDWQAEKVVDDSFIIYPYGEDQVIGFEREPKDTDQILLDTDELTVILIDIDPEDFFGYTLTYYIVNKSDKKLMFTTETASVNGFEIDPFYATTILPGKKTVSSMYWFESSFEKNKIEEVEEIEIVFKAYDDEDWSSDKYISEPIFINP